jgi:hypothetical protein
MRLSGGTIADAALIERGAEFFDLRRTTGETVFPDDAVI